MKTISTEQEKNTEVLEQLQEYAQLYFDAIIDANTDAGGECKLKIGKYSARELVSMDRDYELPRDTMFDEDITIEAGSFRCTIQYRQIFYILAKWEQMMRVGKQKAVFEIGSVEEKSVKVLLQETTPTGRYKEKRVRMQRITGNWWASRKADRDGKFALYYELNSVIFLAKYWSDDPQSESTKKWCAEYRDAEIKKLVIDYLVNFPESESYGYYSEVARRANVEAEPVATGTETAQISTETAETVDCATEGETTQEARNYRFTQNEIEEMKQQILGECEFNATALKKGYKKVFPEMGEYSALNIRRSYEGYINEFAEGSKNRKFYERRLALYESLTENDKPNFTHTPPQTPTNATQFTHPPRTDGVSFGQTRYSA